MSILYECDGCLNYFCNDCAAEMLGELRFCPTCTGSSRAMSIILADSKLQADPVVWRHVGMLLNPGERVDVPVSTASSLAAPITISEAGVKYSHASVSITNQSSKDPAGATRTRSYSKIECLAKGLELCATRRHWGELASAMEWGDTVTIAVETSASGASDRRTWLSSLGTSFGSKRDSMAPESNTEDVAMLYSQRTASPSVFSNLGGDAENFHSKIPNRSIPEGSFTHQQAPQTCKINFKLSCADVFTIALHSDPLEPTTWANLALAMPSSETVVVVGQRRFSQPQCFERALALDPNNESLLVSYANSIAERLRKSYSHGDASSGMPASAQSLFSSECSTHILGDSPASGCRMHISERSRLLDEPTSTALSLKTRSSMTPLGTPHDQLDSALRSLRKALAINSMNGSAWAALANLMDFNSEPACVEIDVGSAAAATSIIDVDVGSANNVSKIIALRMAATLLFTEEAIFRLAMELKAKDATPVQHRVHSSQTKSPESGAYLLTRAAVLESLAELHIKSPKRFPLASAKVSFAITSARSTSSAVLHINSRFLITSDYISDATQDVVKLDDPANFKTNRTLAVTLSAPFEVLTESGKVIREAENTVACRIQFVCSGAAPITTRDCDLEKHLVIGKGTQGIVLRSVHRDPATGVLSSLAMKAFLYVPAVRARADSNGDPLTEVADGTLQQDTLFEELVNANGDLRFLLSDKTAGITVPGRHAVAVDLLNPDVFAQLSSKGFYTPGKFILPCTVPTVPVRLSGSEVVPVQPRPLLVMIFMDRALFSLNRRCSREQYIPLPPHLAPRIFNVPESAYDADRHPWKHACAERFTSGNRILLESEARYYMREVVSHLNRLHHKGFGHGDIKPDNILLMPNGNVCLADFGVAWRRQHSPSQQLHAGGQSLVNRDEQSGDDFAAEKSAESDTTASDSVSQRAVNDEGGRGTYLAPPPQRGGPPPHVGAEDVWALGQSLRFLLTSVLPSSRDHEEPPALREGSMEFMRTHTMTADDASITALKGPPLSIRVDLIDKTIRLRCEHLAKVGDAPEKCLSQECVAFLQMCLRHDAHERATCQELLQSAFLREDL